MDSTARFSTDEYPTTVRLEQPIKSLRDSYQKRSSLPQSYDIFFNEAPAAAVVVDDGMSCEQLVKIVNKHCHSITALRVNFRIAHGIKDGTWSSVGLLLGGHGGVDGLIPLAKEARPGFQVDNLDVDLKLVFESDVVPLRDIQLIRLLDIPGNRYYGPDSWVFGGITLTATCADFPEKMEMLKYATVNKEMKRETGRFDMETVWEGDVELKDWNRQP
ncbi:hypothetical protein XA68_18340 [Ophiocordyceps unilateralis]|uniref:Uncharacterized protein n=1 Tax=Ophiocordyceps unilateralis TaxID=268505 RepID=A0A2A9P397_OPHUN|nr:hypothetical protein XA68_18340 [Ophiocordyceps unilateralis]